MGGTAFTDKYSISTVDKEVANSIMGIIARNFEEEHYPVGNTENVILDKLDSTGDIDVIINLEKEDLFEKLGNISCCVERKTLANNVLTVFRYGGRFYQVDFMTTKNIELGKWLMKGNPNINGPKGFVRNLLFAMLCKEMSQLCSREGIVTTRFTLTFPGELRFSSTSSDGSVTKDIFIGDEKKIRSVLRLSIDTKKYKYDTFESVVDYLLEKDIYTCEELLEKFSIYTENAWSVKKAPGEREKAIEYIKSKQI